MLKWLENYVGNLVQHPDQVSVSTKDGVKVRVVQMAVASDDLSLFQGRNNRLLRAMNSVLSLAGARERVRYVLKIVD